MAIIGLIAATSREPWTAEALCAETDPDIFYPPQGGSPREAKLVCLGCPVRVQCLDFALRNHERWGIWGGLTEHEREGLRRSSRQSLPPLRVWCRNGHPIESKADLGYGRLNCRQCARDNWRRNKDRQRAGGGIK